MPTNNNNVSFPQANDLNKIIEIVNICNEEKLQDCDFMRNLIKVTTNRQVAYYLSAVQYLGIINNSKEFTEAGNYLRTLGISGQKIELARLILSDKVMGTVYLSEKLYGFIYSIEDIVEVMKRFIHFDSEAMYERRAQSAKSWIAWVNKNIK